MFTDQYGVRPWAVALMMLVAAALLGAAVYFASPHGGTTVYECSWEGPAASGHYACVKKERD